MSFFEPPAPPPPPPEPYRPPAWTGPGDDAIPGTVVLDALVARTDDVLVALRGGDVFPTGLSFAVHVAYRLRGPRNVERDPFSFPEPDGLRIGIALPGGARAVLDDSRRGRLDVEGPDGPVLLSRGGSGRPRHVVGRLWLWPLPPPGPVELVLAWPVEGIAETRVPLPGDAILAAAQRVLRPWPDDGDGDGG